MSKCEECGLEDDHKMSCDSSFDEKAWNDERVKLENAVIGAVLDLSHFMGCNSFTLPTTLVDIKVLLTQREANALPD